MLCSFGDPQVCSIRSYSVSHSYAPQNWVCLLFILKIHILIAWYLNFCHYSSPQVQASPFSGYPDLFRGCFSQLHHQEMSLVRSIILCMDGPVKLWVDVMPDPFGASFCEGALTLWHLLLANFLPMLQHLPNPCNIFLWNHVPNADWGLVMLNPLPSPYSGTFLCSQRVLGLLHKIHLW